jgi:hypothetical protein
VEFRIGRLALAQLSLGIGLALVLIALVSSIAYRLRRRIPAPLLLGVLERVLRGGARGKAVKLCRSIDVPATGLALFALGIEEPAQLFGESAGGFREAVPSSSFGERLRERLATASRTLQRRQRLVPILASLGLLGGGLAVASWPLGRPALDWQVSALGWPLFPLLVAVGGVLGAVIGIEAHWQIVRGLRLLERELPALLVPVEDLDEGAREASASAREELARSRWRIDRAAR